MAIPHARPGQPIDLAPLGESLTRAASHAILKTRALELIRLVLTQGKALPPHRVRGEATIFCIEGELAVIVEGETCRLAADQLVLLEADTEYAVHAVTDCSALLTVQLPPGMPGSASSTD
jgi:quercetin dioxygenase-like cupin family protein